VDFLGFFFEEDLSQSGRVFIKGISGGAFSLEP